MEEKKMHVRIVPMTADHLDEVAELERLCFSVPWSRNMLAEELDNALSAMLVALDSGRCDLVVTDMPTAMAACIAYPNFTLLDFAGSSDDFQVSEEEINIGISLQKGNTELLDAINGVLAEMTVDDFTEMMNQAISVQPLSE